MVYKFDPTYSTATIFDLDDSTRMMEKGWMEFVRENEPIPASYFPKSLTIERASASCVSHQPRHHRGVGAGACNPGPIGPRRGRVHSGHHSSGTRQHGSIRCSMPFIPFAISPV